MFSTGTLDYLLFINNRAELNNVKHQMNYDTEFNE